ncbi:hypothetical protein C8Q80DRAFT_610572 [Daedaleopsis nitida]|nr:hypothetical protein C8Q80DRAFT_610572 [Daedaleopsis nitida]
MAPHCRSGTPWSENLDVPCGSGGGLAAMDQEEVLTPLPVLWRLSPVYAQLCLDAGAASVRFQKGVRERAPRLRYLDLRLCHLERRARELDGDHACGTRCPSSHIPGTAREDPFDRLQTAVGLEIMGRAATASVRLPRRYWNDAPPPYSRWSSSRSSAASRRGQGSPTTRRRRTWTVCTARSTTHSCCARKGRRKGAAGWTSLRRKYGCGGSRDARETAAGRQCRCTD